jgi:large subunit ribosomal protein L25
VSEVRLSAEPRTEFGKGAARRTRRASKVPAVLYGHGTEPRHLALPGHELFLALKGGANTLIRLDLGDGESQLALAKDVQRDPIKGFLEHVDLVVVERGEKVTVEVPVTMTGEGAGDAIVTQQLMTVSVEADATQIPDGVDVSVEGLGVGETVTAGQLDLPEGAQLAGDSEQVLVSAVAAPTNEQLDAELASAEAELGAGETGAAAQAAAAAEVGDGVTDRSTGEGDIVAGSDEGSGGPTQVAGDEDAGTNARPTTGA